MELRYGFAAASLTATTSGSSRPAEMAPCSSGAGLAWATRRSDAWRDIAKLPHAAQTMPSITRVGDGPGGYDIGDRHRCRSPCETTCVLRLADFFYVWLKRTHHAGPVVLDLPLRQQPGSRGEPCPVLNQLAKVGDARQRRAHYRDLMRPSGSAAGCSGRRRPHRHVHPQETGGVGGLFSALIEAGFTITAWPVKRTASQPHRQECRRAASSSWPRKREPVPAAYHRVDAREIRARLTSAERLQGGSTPWTSSWVLGPAMEVFSQRRVR